MNRAIAATEAVIADLTFRIAKLKEAERAGLLSCCAECSGLGALEFDLEMSRDWLAEATA
jgi:hypothetical protein